MDIYYLAGDLFRPKDQHGRRRAPMVQSPEDKGVKRGFRAGWILEQYAFMKPVDGMARS